MLTRFAYLLIVVFIGIVSIVVSQLTRGRIVETTSFVTSPAQTAVGAPGSLLDGLFGNLGNAGQLRQENEELRAEIASLRQQVVKLPELENENQILRDQLAYRQSQPDLKTRSARIIGHDTNPLVDSVTVDQGTSAGLSDGLVAVSPAGLVGRVERAGPSSSKVLLLTDSASAVNCVIQGSRARGVAEGTTDGSLVMRFVGQGDAVRVGDKVVTSGLGTQFPPGLLVGTVSDVRRNDADPFQVVTVAPAVDFDHLESVLVVTSFVPGRLD